MVHLPTRHTLYIPHVPSIMAPPDCLFQTLLLPRSTRSAAGSSSTAARCSPCSLRPTTAAVWATWARCSRSTGAARRSCTRLRRWRAWSSCPATTTSVSGWQLVAASKDVWCPVAVAVEGDNLCWQQLWHMCVLAESVAYVCTCRHNDLESARATSPAGYCCHLLLHSLRCACRQPHLPCVRNRSHSMTCGVRGPSSRMVSLLTGAAAAAAALLFWLPPVS